MENCSVVRAHMLPFVVSQLWPFRFSLSLLGHPSLLVFDSRMSPNVRSRSLHCYPPSDNAGCRDIGSDANGFFKGVLGCALPYVTHCAPNKTELEDDWFLTQIGVVRLINHNNDHKNTLCMEM